MKLRLSTFLTLSFFVTISAFAIGQTEPTQPVVTKLDITAELAKDLDNTNWIGNSGVYLSSTSKIGIGNSAVMVFGYSEGSLYYLSKINPVLDKLINKGAGGLCVSSLPRRVEFFRNSQTGEVSGSVFVPRIDKKTGARSTAQINLEHVNFIEEGARLQILDWEIVTKKGKKKYIPTRYDLRKADLSAAPPADSSATQQKNQEVAKALRAQIDVCLKEKPWLQAR